MTYTERDFNKLMKVNGFVKQTGRGKGSHIIYKKDNQTISIGDSFNKMVIRRLIKEYNLITI